MSVSVEFPLVRGETPEPPLCVDLDGTLVRGDLLAEAALQLVKSNILYLLLLPLWLLQGKAALKRRIAERVELHAASLPYNEPFLAYLREQHADGRDLVLVTASDAMFAAAVAAHLGIFDAVLASDGITNLSGRAKAEKLVRSFGRGGFDYAANGRVDLAVWQHARQAVLVNPERGVCGRLPEGCPVAGEFDDRDSGLAPYLKALRPHQWLKSLLVFVPLVMAHKHLDAGLAQAAVLAFIAFGLCASSVYVLNDLLDIAADRRHPRKCRRPFASGRLPVLHGVVMVPLLLGGAYAVAYGLPRGFLGALGLYYIVTLLYSFRLKRIVLFDVLTLAGLYTMRLIAGGAAVGIPLSFWLLAFSMFVFLSLAFAKRYVELLNLPEASNAGGTGRGYREVDLESLAQFGTTSGYMAVLVLALYIDSAGVKQLYTHPEVIWLICPLMLYIMSRIWLQARRNRMPDDPVVFAIRDRRSQVVGGMILVLLWLATV